MKLGDVWFSAIAEAENSDRMIVVSGRTEIEPFIQSGKFKERVEITWKYEADSKGMPNETTGKMMEEVQTVLKQAMEKDKLAIFTGIYTGDGERTWVFYTRNIPAFGRMLNEPLAPFETLPLTIYTEKDPEWNEYREMCELQDQDNDDEDLDEWKRYGIERPFAQWKKRSYI